MTRIKGNVKKLTIVLLFLFVIIFFFISYTPKQNRLLSSEKRLSHQFVAYEAAFGNLNLFNENPQNTCSRTSNIIPDCHNAFILTLAHATTELDNSLNKIKMSFPYTKELINEIFSWKKDLERQVLSGKSILYWQVDLLKYEMQLVDLLNNKYAEINYKIENLAEKYELQLKNEKKEVLCKMISQFDPSDSPDRLAEQIAAIKLVGNSCK